MDTNPLLPFYISPNNTAIPTLVKLSPLSLCSHPIYEDKVSPWCT